MVQDKKTGLYLPEMTEMERREMQEMEENGELPTKIDRSMDLFFRFLLGVPARVELLLDLINSLFSVLGYPLVEHAELIHTEIPPGGAGLKHSRLDIRAWDVMGRLLSIELQRENHMYFIPRCLYYLSKMFLERLWVWGGYMCNDKMGVELVRTTLTGDAVFHKVKQAEAEYWNSPEYRYWQTRAQMERMDQQAYQEDAWNRGRAQGMAQGRAQGRNEERKIIMERLIAGGMAPQDAARYTGLSM